MRKIALLTVPMLIFGLVSLSAQEMEMMGPAVNSPVTAEVSGESTLTWGINLENNATGFRNESTADLKVTIVPKASVNTGMMEDTDDLYAYIELNDFEWVVTSADGQGKTTAPSVTTKLIMGAFSIKTFSGPTVKVDYVDTVDGDDDNGDDKEDEFPGPDFDDVATAYTGMGLTVAYAIDPVILSLGVVSENDWTESKPDPENKDVVDCHTHGPNDDGDIVLMKCPADDKDDQNDENAYAFIGTINLAIGENADLEAKVAYAHEYTAGGYENTDDIGVGAKATFNLGDITPHIAFDTAIPSGGAAIPWDVGGGVKWNLSADEKSSFSTDLMMYSPSVGDSKLYVAASLVEGEGDDGALEGMGATLTVGLNDAAGDSEWNARVKASYKVEGIKPYFELAFGSKDDAMTSFKAGLELTMIAHLTTTLQYASEDIGGTDQGEVTTALKISY
jgi:hypothetical protein